MNYAESEFVLLRDIALNFYKKVKNEQTINEAYLYSGNAGFCQQYSTRG